MKTLKALMILTAAISVNVATAAKAPKTFSAPDEIKKSMRYPEFAKESQLQGFVAVEYNISSDGKITVLEMNASDEKLAAYVRQKLESTMISNCEYAGNYKSKFKFTFRGR